MAASPIEHLAFFLVVLLPFLALVGVAYRVYGRATVRQWNRVIAETARRLGLRYTTGRWATRVEAHGYVRGFRLRIQVLRIPQEQGYQDRVRITVEGPTLEKGQISRVLTGFIDHPARLVEICNDVLDSATELRGHGQPTPAQLQENALHHPLESLRRRNLRLLLERFDGTEQAAQALEAALGDPDASVRLLAAERAGERGLPAAATVDDDELASVALRIRALRLLGAHGPRLDAPTPGEPNRWPTRSSLFDRTATPNPEASVGSPVRG